MGDSESLMSVREHLRVGQVIPAHPLALTADRTLDEARQRGLTRYYIDAGAGGVAVGVHTTQFAIRDSAVGLFRPVLELAMDEAKSRADTSRPFAMIAGVCGHTAQARTEAEIAAALGYDAGLLSLGDWRTESEAELLEHCRIIGETIPLFGFYLQPAVGGRVLSYRFWREFAEIPSVWAIKIAPFNRYQTIDVIRAVVESGRDDIALYTGNDDNIVADLLTPFPVHVGGATVVRWIDGGLLGQWAVWTRAAVAMLARIKAARESAAARRIVAVRRCGAHGCKFRRLRRDCMVSPDAFQAFTKCCVAKVCSMVFGVSIRTRRCRPGRRRRSRVSSGAILG